MEPLTTTEAIKLALAIGGFILTLIGGIIVRDRNVSKRISDGNQKLHDRVDDLKDKMNSEFARKGDVNESIRRVERGIEGLGKEMRDNHKSLTELLIERLK